jgi:hypothetical protein
VAATCEAIDIGDDCINYGDTHLLQLPGLVDVDRARAMFQVLLNEGQRRFEHPAQKTADCF